MRTVSEDCTELGCGVILVENAWGKVLQEEWRKGGDGNEDDDDGISRKKSERQRVVRKA